MTPTSYFFLLDYITVFLDLRMLVSKQTQTEVCVCVPPNTRFSNQRQITTADRNISVYVSVAAAACNTLVRTYCPSNLWPMTLTSPLSSYDRSTQLGNQTRWIWASHTTRQTPDTVGSSEVIPKQRTEFLFTIPIPRTCQQVVKYLRLNCTNRPTYHPFHHFLYCGIRVCGSHSSLHRCKQTSPLGGPRSFAATLPVKNLSNHRLGTIIRCVQW